MNEDQFLVRPITNLDSANEITLVVNHHIGYCKLIQRYASVNKHVLFRFFIFGVANPAIITFLKHFLYFIYL